MKKILFFLSLFFSLPFACVHAGLISRPPSNLGLVGYWPMDEGVGTKAGDVSGQANTGAITGATWINGKHGKALSFDGSSDYTSVAKNFTFTNEISISAWVYLNSYQSVSYTPDWASRTILDTYKLTDPNGNDQMHYISIYGTSNGVAQAGINWDVTVLSTNRASVNGNVVPLRQWQLITMTADGANLKLYQNGVYVNQTSYTNIGLYDPDLLNIGKFAKSTLGGYFDGKIDDVRIYNRALTATEIQSLYKQNSTTIGTSYENRLTDGLVGFWTMNGKDINWLTNTVTDRSGQGNNGNLVNMSTTTSPAVGKVGQALSFNHARSRVTVPDVASLRPTNVTVSAWVYQNSSQAAYLVLKDKSLDVSYQLTNSIGGTGNYFSFCSYVSGSYTCAETPNTVGAWVHLVGIYDGTNRYLYVNGILKSTVPGGAIDYTSSLPLHIGGYTVANKGLDGKLDEVRIYNRALSADEVKQLYNMGK